jgi:Na+-translocating ferredoxin:NAD+ oxidoreductase RnfE subunit
MYIEIRNVMNNVQCNQSNSMNYMHYQLYTLYNNKIAIVAVDCQIICRVRVFLHLIGVIDNQVDGISSEVNTNNAAKSIAPDWR